MFKFEDVENFDDHIKKSIPNYDRLVRVLSTFVYEYLTPKGTIVDLGCSQGGFLSSLNKIDAKYIGVDKADIKGRKDGFNFILGDAYDVLNNTDGVELISSIFFLQFLGKNDRVKMLNLIGDKVDSGATLLIAEKVIISDAKVNSVIHRCHMAEKRHNFTDKEILDKDDELFGTMFCQTDAKLEHELSQIGKPTQIWQSYGFKAWIVTK